MRSLGLWLFVLGAGSFILPFFSLQFCLLSILGPYLFLVGGFAAVFGPVLVVLSMVNLNKNTEQQS
jgi:hypothetical protein